MLFPIRQNGMLNGMYHLIYRLAFIRGQFIEGRMTVLIRIANLQRVVQVVFGNIVDTRDHLNSHPGVNCTHVTFLDLTILLAETLHCLNSINNRKSKNSQHEEQQKAE